MDNRDVLRGGLLLAPERMQEKWAVKNGLVMPVEMAGRKKRWPVGIDLFCGCGGFSLGAMQAGVHMIAACDNDVAAAISYTYNLGEHPMKFVFLSDEDEKRMERALRKEMGFDAKSGKIKKAFVTGNGYKREHNEVPGCQVFFLGDIRKLTGERILAEIGMEPGQVDVVCGGPPCQGFSYAGKRNVMDPRNSLVFEFVRLVLEIYPRTLVMENVPGIANMVTVDGVPVMDAVCQALENGGFGAQDMLKKTLLATVGLNPGGAMRRAGKKNEVVKEVEVESGQLKMF